MDRCLVERAQDAAAELEREYSPRVAKLGYGLIAKAVILQGKREHLVIDVAIGSTEKSKHYSVKKSGRLVKEILNEIPPTAYKGFPVYYTTYILAEG